MNGDCRSTSHGDKISGRTLIESLLALTLIAVVLMGIAGTFLSNSRSYEVTREESLATHAMREVAEKMRTVPSRDVVANYQGYTFAVPEINGNGTVQIFVDETDSSSAAQILGLPRDLDGDAAATTTAVSNTYLLLPVRIELNWTHFDDARSSVLSFFLAEESH